MANGGNDGVISNSSNTGVAVAFKRSRNGSLSGGVTHASML